MSIPVISPIEIKLGEPTVRMLPAPPDYEVHALPPAAVLIEEATEESTTASAQESTTDPAIAALDEMEHATQISEYHDFSWWDERIRLIRARLEDTH
ncbi:MAG: hypothetical protein ABI035_02830 [Gemmatimonadaceae bacterium]